MDTETPMNPDHAEWLRRRAEDAERDRLKAEAYKRPITVHDSNDPTTGLQPAVGSHDAWAYRPRRNPHCTGCGAPLDPKWCDPAARAAVGDR